MILEILRDFITQICVPGSIFNFKFIGYYKSVSKSRTLSNIFSQTLSNLPPFDFGTQKYYMTSPYITNIVNPKP